MKSLVEKKNVTADPVVAEGDHPVNLPELSASALNADIISFEPFAETFLCSGCERPLSLYVQPLHLTERINCPRCGRPLSNQIRRAIQKRRGV